MASPGNPNQVGGGGAFDVNKFFKPSSPIPQNPSNLSSSPYAPPPPSYAPSPPSSFPPPTGPYSYPPQASSPFHHQYQPHHLPYAAADHQLSTLHHQRSISFPTPPLQLPSHIQSPSPNPNPGARLMALLSSPPPSNLEMAQQPSVPLQLTNSGGSDFSVIPPSIAQSQTMNSAIVQSAPLRMPSSKLPKGRHLAGDHAIYDIDVRLQGEVQPQLEVTPITKYVSDPQLVVGRQIAVNKTYICYGLKLGNIRILNINTALRSLFRGHTQRVTDMAFFAEDVHLLASVSIDGRVCVWKISEGPDEEDKPQITGTIVIALQITGDGEPKHPRVCWHCHKQEVLVVGFGQRVLRIDTTKIGKGEVYSAEEPLKCPVDRLIDGVQTVGKHDGEVTDLSMCQWMTTRLVSASMDGTIKIWEDRKALPLCVLRPHDGEPVYSATFLTAPHRPDHIILITAGPQNREVKIWVSASEEGWLLPSDAESWHCTQRLDLKSSSEPHIEEAFFNQVVALPQAGLLLLANAKKNAIYAVHLEYGLKPAATAMDYIAEFTVTMPILSFTGTSDLLPHGERIVQVYCVQTQAIQQYALDLAQCLPPPLDHMGLEKSDSTVSRDATNTETIGFLEPSGSKITENRLSSSPPKPLTEGVSIARSIVSSASTEAMSLQDLSTSPTETKSVALPPTANGPDIVCVNTPPTPLSPRLSGQSSGLQSPISSFEPVHPLSDHGGSQTIVDYPVERQMDNVHAFADSPSLDDDSKTIESNTSHDDISAVQNAPVMFKHPTHLVTPSEIFMAASSSESTHVIEGNNDGEVNIPDVVVSMSNVEMEVKVAGEVESIPKDESVTHAERQNPDSGSKEKSFCSQVSDLGIEMAKENSALLESYITDEARRVDGGSVTQVSFQSSSPVEEGVNDSSKDVSRKVSDSTCQLLSPPTKGKKQKGKNSQLSGASSPSPSAFNSTDSSNEAGVSSSLPSVEASFPQIVAMQETVNQLMSMQKELQKQMTVMVAVPVTKEGRRLEAALGRSMEKAAKANADALWARIQEEHVKQERLLRDRTQQITMLMNNFISKDLPTMLEKAVKKEVAAIGPAVARTITTSLEKAVASVITDTLQRGLGDKAVNQLDKSVNSKLEATVARQIQAQFQTSGKQALQETLKSSLESAVIPAFELSCKAMFDQVDATFQKGIAEHTTAAQQQFESSHSPLAIALRDAVNSASSMTQTLSGELADGQRKLLAFVAAGGNSTAGNPLVTQMSNGSVGGIHEKAEAPLDPTKELSRLISEHKYEEAFTGALQRSDVSIVSWLCSQVDMQGILAMVPMPLSQGVLLSLLQQLACGISKDTPRKLGWMTDVAVAINPADPMIVVHVRPIFEQVYQILNHHRSLPTTTSAQTSSIRLVMHVINSMLSSCK